MKKSVFLLFLLFSTVLSNAENLFSVAKFDIQPGEEQTVSVVLTNDEDAKSVAIDIMLPEGLSFVGTNGSVVFSERTAAMTTKNAVIQSSGALRIGMMGFGTVVSAGTGELFTFKVKADENTSLGNYKISYSAMALTLATLGKITLDDFQSDVEVYRTYKVELTVNNSAMGTVQGATNSVRVNSSVTVTATPNTGYEFVKWTDGENDITTENPYTFTVTDNVSLTAVFKAKSYTMTFVLGNGDDNVVMVQDYNTTLTAPSGFTKTNYTFNGWNPAVPATVPASDMTFTAIWTPTEFAITYNLDGGSLAQGVTNPAMYTVESETFTLNNPTREGYTFAGWTGTDLTEATMSVSIAKGSAGDRIFTATWTINQYTMTFVLDNGDENVVKTQDYGTALTAPENLVKTGFTFKGWSPAVPATVPASDMTFTAQWERNKYKVTWIVDGQSTVNEVEYEAAIVKPNDPVKEGYTFTGWDNEIPATMPANDLTFTAQFSINQYTMTFVLGNGQENVVKVQDYASALTAPEDPVKTGFTFKGWSPAVPATVPASDMTFTAQWERNKYKVTWIVDGQSTVNEVEYEAAIVKPNDPVKEGYTFTGWDNEIPATMPANDLTFTAQFKINTYAVIYMVKGEEWARDSLTYGATIVKREYTAAEDETFNGWVSDAEYTTMPAHDVVFTAQITSGIAELQMNKENVTIYRLDGTLVARNMKLADAMKKLAKGVYIINGKKINIK